MSAPQTNIEKQKRWHRGPLIGMALVALFGVSMIIFLLMYESKNAGDTDPIPDDTGISPPTESPAETAPAAPPATAPATSPAP